MNELSGHTINHARRTTQSPSARKGGPDVRATRLALALSAALLSPLAFPALAGSTSAPSPLGALVERSDANDPQGEPLTVANCNDSGAGSLRDIISNVAQSGDTVNLATLPLVCGTISLSTGEIVITQDDLTLQGPDSGDGTVRISGGGISRVFQHLGTGTLGLNYLTITDGYVLSNGGCINSYGSVSANRTVVADCTTGNSGDGGGIYAAQTVTLVLSAITGNEAIGNARGGGIFSRRLTAKYSSISDNYAARGGGARTPLGATIIASTIDQNMAETSGGLYLDGDSTISNSTISGNISTFGAAALRSRGDITISNSTIAFNHSDVGLNDGYGAVELGTPVLCTLTLQSSILANNTAGIGNSPADLYLPVGSTLSGADNVIIASNIVSPPPGVITVTTDPQLGPLAFNGGTTRTHALLPGSPALGVGNNTAMRTNDQRGDGYPRTTGHNASVDIGAVQFDTIFADDFDFD